MNDYLLERLKRTHTSARLVRREFLELHENLPPLPKNKPSLDSKIHGTQWLNSLYKASDGVVFGEEHFDNLSVGFLVRHISHLAQLGVDIFFFEGLYYGYEKGLDGKREIKDSVHDEYQQLITLAQKYQIKIIGIDHMGAKCGEGITRDIFMNAFAASVINNTPKNKWLALVGMMHLNTSCFIDSYTFERFEVKGLSELTGAPSVILDAIGQGKKYIATDCSFQALPAKKVKADYVIGIHGNKNTHRSPQQNNTVTGSNIKSLEVFIKSLGGKLTHYDIDSFAIDDQAGSHIPGVIFAFSLPTTDHITLGTIASHMQLSVNASAQNSTAPNQWLDVALKEDLNEIICCCHIARVNEVITAIIHSIESHILYNVS